MINLGGRARVRVPVGVSVKVRVSKFLWSD